MYKHILIATDGSELAERAVVHGVALAAKVDAQVTIVTVTEPWSALDIAIDSHEHVTKAIEKFNAEAASAAQKILNSAAQKAQAAGVKFGTIRVPDTYPAEGIVKTAETRRCDLIVMSSHGRRGIERLWLGSEAYKVVTLSKAPTLIVK